MGPSVSHPRFLVVLRAAAVLVIATGVNDIVAGALPAYEPLYLFLGASALVVLLDGVLAGVAGAIGATAIYALLFTPRADVWSWRLLVPLGASVAVAILAGAVHRLVRDKRPEKSSSENELVAQQRAFDERLQTIVHHLAAEHESDIGVRVTSLQKRLDDSTRAVAEVRAAAQQEISRLRRRIAELERAAGAASIDGMEQRPRVLIAHPDAELRESPHARASSAPATRSSPPRMASKR